MSILVRFLTRERYLLMQIHSVPKGLDLWNSWTREMPRMQYMSWMGFDLEGGSWGYVDHGRGGNILMIWGGDRIVVDTAAGLGIVKIEEGRPLDPGRGLGPDRGRGQDKEGQGRRRDRYQGVLAVQWWGDPKVQTPIEEEIERTPDRQAERGRAGRGREALWIDIHKMTLTTMHNVSIKLRCLTVFISVVYQVVEITILL